MTRRWIAVVLATLLVMTTAVWAITLAQSRTTRTAVAGPGPVIVIGAGGLSWDDVSAADTPALWSLIRRAATGSVTVRSVELNTCPLDGWLSLSAGQRAGDAGPDGSAETAVTATGDRPACRALPEVPAVPAMPSASGQPEQAEQAGKDAGSVLPGWDTWRQVAAKRPFRAEPGLLGQTLADHDVCVQAIGPGAAIAAADRFGRVKHYAPFTAGLPLSACPVTIVDVGAVRDPADVDPRDGQQPLANRVAQVRSADQRIGSVLRAAPPGAHLLLTGLSDAGRSEHLRVLALAGPGVPTGAVYSPSTRQVDLAQASDITATTLALAGVQVPDAVSGGRLEVEPAESRNADAPRSKTGTVERSRVLRDMGQAAHAVHPLVGPFFVVWGLVQIAVYAAGALAWRRAGTGQDVGQDAAQDAVQGIGHADAVDTGAEHDGKAAAARDATTLARRRIAHLVAAAATAAAAVPVSTFLANLVPWWRVGVPAAGLLAAVAVSTASISLVALTGPWRTRLLGPAAVVAGATATVLTLDVMTGSRLQLSSLLGLQPVVAGRFFGMGNVTFALFGTAALLLAVCLASPLRGQRRWAAATVLVIGLAAVVVDGWPAWGADFGGPPALVPAFGYLLLAALGVRLTWRRAAGIIVVTIGLLTTLAVLDWLRPREARTHLGAFVQSVIGGGGGDVISRKLNQNLEILLSSPLTMAVPIVLAAIIYVIARPTSRVGRRLAPLYAVPLARAGLVALVICFVIGFALNDSGTAIPAVGATLAIPLLIAISVSSAAIRDHHAAGSTAVGSAGPSSTTGSGAGPPR